MKNYGWTGLVLLLVVALLGSVGCGGKKGAKKGSGTSLGEVQSFDNGRLSVPGPKDWELASRSNKYVAMFRNTKSEGVSLYVTAEPAPGGMTAMTSENADTVKETIKGDPDTFQVVEVGPYTCISGARLSRSEDYDYDNRLLVTVQEGRRYEFVLRTYKGSMTNSYVKLLQAVVEKAKFGPETEAVPLEVEEDGGGFGLSDEFNAPEPAEEAPAAE